MKTAEQKNDGEGGKMVPLPQTSADGIQSLDAAALSKLFGRASMAPQVVSLEPPNKNSGVVQTLTGFYLGLGAGVEVEDASGDLKEIPTHDFETDSKAVVSLMGSHQLDNDLPFYIGRRIVVARGNQKETAKGRRVTKFAIGDLSDDRAAFANALPDLKREARAKKLSPQDVVNMMRKRAADPRGKR